MVGLIQVQNIIYCWRIHCWNILLITKLSFTGLQGDRYLWEYDTLFCVCLCMTNCYKNNGLRKTLICILYAYIIETNAFRCNGSFVLQFYLFSVVCIFYCDFTQKLILNFNRTHFTITFSINIKKFIYQWPLTKK